MKEVKDTNRGKQVGTKESRRRRIPANTATASGLKPSTPRTQQRSNGHSEDQPKHPPYCQFCKSPVVTGRNCELCSQGEPREEHTAATASIVDPAPTSDAPAGNPVAKSGVRGRSLPELAAELLRQKTNIRDFVAPANHVALRTNGKSRLVLNHTVNEAFVVNEVAHHQLADYLGIQRKFYEDLKGNSDRLFVPVWAPAQSALPHSEEPITELRDRTMIPEGVEDSPLIDVVVNTLLRRKEGDGRLIRTLDGRVRAFLSDTYNPDLDNYDVFMVAAGVIEANRLGPNDVISAEVTERSLYIKVVSPRLKAEIKPANVKPGNGFLREPQVVQAGFIISNSETGLGALTVQQTVYKLMCTNLWIKADAYKVRHIGKELETDQHGMVYRNDTRIADAKAKMLKVRDQVAETLEEHRFTQMVAQMQATTEIKLGTNIERVVEVTAKKFGLAKLEQDTVLKNLIEGADLTLWGLTNAVTATAHESDSYDRATELEEIGGRMFSIPVTDLREIVHGT
jgi:hypothetical protein